MEEYTYLVIREYGEYEDFGFSIDKAFKNEEDANKYVKKMQDRYDKLKSMEYDYEKMSNILEASVPENFESQDMKDYFYEYEYWYISAGSFATNARMQCKEIASKYSDDDLKSMFGFFVYEYGDEVRFKIQKILVE